MIELTAVAALGGLTLLLTTVLVVANAKLTVVEDPRIEAVEQMLPGTNCGACGHPGCHAFAMALVAGKALPGKCSVSTETGRERIAAFLGVDVGAAMRRVARLACAGGSNVARNRADYRGHQSCASAALIAGGGKGCFWGCLGLGDCERSCDRDAIHMNAHGLPVVVEDACTACGDCVAACPKDLFQLQSVEQPLWVACKNLLQGDEVLEECTVACTACGRCAKDAPLAIEMHDNLPRIRAGAAADVSAIARCPTGAIVWIDEHGKVTRGDAAATIARHTPRPTAPT